VLVGDGDAPAAPSGADVDGSPDVPDAGAWGGAVPEAPAEQRGAAAAAAAVTCPQCGGVGWWLPKDRANAPEAQVPCLYCLGTGLVETRYRDHWHEDFPEGR
jgi:hypothetical protein